MPLIKSLLSLLPSRPPYGNRSGNVLYHKLGPGRLFVDASPPKLRPAGFLRLATTSLLCGGPPWFSLATYDLPCSAQYCSSPEPGRPSTSHPVSGTASPRPAAIQTVQVAFARKRGNSCSTRSSRAFSSTARTILSTSRTLFWIR